MDTEAAQGAFAPSLWDDNPSAIDLLGFDAVVAPVLAAIATPDLDPPFTPKAKDQPESMAGFGRSIWVGQETSAAATRLATSFPSRTRQARCLRKRR